MKNTRYIVLLGLTVLLLASCVGLPPVMPGVTSAGPEQPAGAVAEVATEAPAAAGQAMPALSDSRVVTDTTAVATTAVATTEAVTTPADDQVMGANPLVGVEWQWTALIKTSPATQAVVPDPAAYTLAFADDGSVAIKADCNIARGTYTLTNDQLVITIGPVTLAACPPGSLSDVMLVALGQVGSYMIDGGDLILRLADSGDSMLFRNGGAPSAAATEAPAAAAPIQTAPAPAKAPAQPVALVGPVWQWERFIDVAKGTNTMDVAKPANYTATFSADGTVAMQADCNRAAGTYTVDGARLTVNIGPVTLAACAPGSLGETFLVNLTMAGTYLIEDGKLMIDMMADSGRMVFGAAK